MQTITIRMPPSNHAAFSDATEKGKNREKRGRSDGSRALPGAPPPYGSTSDPCESVGVTLRSLPRLELLTVVGCLARPKGDERSHRPNHLEHERPQEDRAAAGQTRADRRGGPQGGVPPFVRMMLSWLYPFASKTS